MERQIKFRIRLSDRKTKSELTIFSILFGAVDSLMEFPVDLKQWEVISIDQFTGLKDKEKREIYENDIIKDLYGGSHFKIAFGQYENTFCFYAQKVLSEYKARLGGTYGQELNTEVEIIGNIYETPELLTAVGRKNE